MAARIVIGICADLPDQPHHCDRATAYRCDQHRKERRRWQQAWYMRNGPGSKPDPDDENFPYRPSPPPRGARIKPTATPAPAAPTSPQPQAQQPTTAAALEPLRVAAHLHLDRQELRDIAQRLATTDRVASGGIRRIEDGLREQIAILMAMARAQGLSQNQAKAALNQALTDTRHRR
jgi:hypothetical protein